MARCTKADRERLKSLVHETMLKKLSELEALKYINSKMGRKAIKRRAYYYIKNELRDDAHAQMSMLKRGELVLEAYHRIEELKANYRELWKLKDQARKLKNPVQRIRALADIEMRLSDLTMHLAEMYDAMPFMAAVQEKLKKQEASGR